MTEKRFEVVMNEFDEVEYIMDKEMMEDRDFAEFIDFAEDVCKENEQLKQEIETLHEENQKLKKLNIPIDEIKDTVSDYRGRIIGVYYND